MRTCVTTEGLCSGVVSIEGEGTREQTLGDMGELAIGRYGQKQAGKDSGKSQKRASRR